MLQSKGGVLPVGASGRMHRLCVVEACLRAAYGDGECVYAEEEGVWRGTGGPVGKM